MDARDDGRRGVAAGEDDAVDDEVAVDEKIDGSDEHILDRSDVVAVAREFAAATTASREIAAAATPLLLRRCCSREHTAAPASCYSYRRLLLPEAEEAAEAPFHL